MTSEIKPLATIMALRPGRKHWTCASCNAFSPNTAMNPKAGQPRQGWCRAAPPMFVPAQGTDALGRPAIIHQGVWPPTNDDQWCRAWEAQEDRE